ncbi:MAG: hypothetical protein SH848_03945 [Saprospiraceae bacterium]|nr:hypothetical protein [Saprospiraceae bacterium]MDZ4703053.1 hypothetical protein [Saprospiraceae bacterium]
MLTAIIISILLSLGIINTPEEALNLTREQIEAAIVNSDISGV